MAGPIDVSDSALWAFWDSCTKRSPAPAAIRLGVRGGACSGLQYVIEFDDGPGRTGDAEWTLEAQDREVTFRVDRKSLAYLSGSRVSWSKTLMKEGFDFENPHEASRCGCGHSFSAK